MYIYANFIVAVQSLEFKNGYVHDGQVNKLCILNLCIILFSVGLLKYSRLDLGIN